MKRILRTLILSTLALSVFSCEQFLDINENPNQATTSSPQQVLPNALTNTAQTVVVYNDYGSWHVGYIVNAGGFGGWGSTLTYNYTSGDYASLWDNSFDNLNDYKYIETSSQSDPTLAFYNAIAKIMIAYNYQMLVDTYGDVPYTTALQGSSMITPTYDKAEDIYKDLIDNKLDSALVIINTALTAEPRVANAITAGDVMFDGKMSQWVQFANTLKLRMLLRISGVPSLSAYASEKFANFDVSGGFLTEDALVNPGYTESAGKQNPYWDRYKTTAAGTASGAGRSRIPSNYTYSFYDGGKVLDEARGDVTYRNFPQTPTNDLGDESADVPTAPSGNNAWFVGGGIGLFKGPGMGQPIILASESDFLQAEAYLKGYLVGDAQTAYHNGIENSFRYLYKNVTNSVEPGYDPVNDAIAYTDTVNVENPLVNFELAASQEQKLEAIITQKYIALNFIHGFEAWNEYRRTGYPSVSAGSTFASIRSSSPLPDKLPLRILYPASEQQVNPANVPQGIDVFGTRLFYDVD
ncbi:SusD/RagB family nutrient-binding outer membrane lipoprotein [Pontibacter sp. 172403-2]|uniref:SusD/RagB family nutrient-binding outer membrane lipoprotein n=1 Tax=Pontibacter rufus TaxID=2791028 RepID=UPI0018B002F2|nr:SusD/RagB family nutrient-binding outer membrane lipoprotein [Pontibacter sp. 172403-2]MBF9251823.1 SusD/RagB family nutrient-binding outer membrane lipoprotein [Pontibacter sp. 172403-2]